MRTDFNVFGYKSEDMLAIKTKAQMKEVFRQAGLPVAQGRVFQHDADARELAQQLKFRDYQTQFGCGCKRHL